MPLDTNTHYASLPLHRASEERKNAHWITTQLARDDTLIYCLHNDKNLLASGAENTAAISLERHAAEPLLALARKPVFLGMHAHGASFAIDLSAHDPTQLTLPESSEFVDLRRVGPLLDNGEAALLAYARGLVYWHANNQYCARCGALSYGVHGGHARRCCAPACARETFPRTDPAVIMLVEDLSNPDDPKCLLGRNKKFAARMFSTLAGFVDPGETLEECVAREVFEEVGVHVDSIRYQGSQPWPFPSSLMLGFRATAQSLTIDTDADEIEEAYWFSAHDIRTFGEWGDGGDNNCLPRKDSIARHLIEQWLHDLQR